MLHKWHGDPKYTTTITLPCDVILLRPMNPILWPYYSPAKLILTTMFLSELISRGKQVIEQAIYRRMLIPVWESKVMNIQNLLLLLFLTLRLLTMLLLRFTVQKMLIQSILSSMRTINVRWKCYDLGPNFHIQWLPNKTCFISMERLQFL